MGCKAFCFSLFIIPVFTCTRANHPNVSTKEQIHRYNYGKDSYDLGSGFGHFALAVPDVYKTVESIKSAGASYCSACGSLTSYLIIVAYYELLRAFFAYCGQHSIEGFQCSSGVSQSFGRL